MEIRIAKSGRECRACGRTFVHDEPVNSRVFFEVQNLVREDFCAACWSAERAQGAYSTWSLRYYDPKVAEQEPPEVFSPLRQIFYASVEADTRAELAVAYLAAQLLRRQKVFRLIKEDGDGEGHVALFSDRIGNRLIEVQDPSLGFGELEAGRRTLMARLAQAEGGPAGGEAAKNDQLQEN